MFPIAPYIKVYLMDGKNCTEKQKTLVARRTLDPLYQQQLLFAEPYHGKILQVCYLLRYINQTAVGNNGVTLNLMSC